MVDRTGETRLVRQLGQSAAKRSITAHFNPIRESQTEQPLPLVMEPADQVDLADWARNNREYVAQSTLMAEFFFAGST
jgi:hypothetical protein